MELIELKALWYDLLAQKQAVEQKMNLVNEQIAQKLNKPDEKKDEKKVNKNK